MNKVSGEGVSPANDWAEIWDALDNIRTEQFQPAPSPSSTNPPGATMQTALSPSAVSRPAAPSRRRALLLALGGSIGLLFGLLLVAIIATAIAPSEPVGPLVLALVAGTYAGGGVLIAAILSAGVHPDGR